MSIIYAKFMDLAQRGMPYVDSELSKEHCYTINLLPKCAFSQPLVAKDQEIVAELNKKKKLQRQKKK